MNKEMLDQLQKLTSQEGPFMDFNRDTKFVTELLEWISGDWEKLRVLLNYVHERGEIVAAEIITSRSAAILSRSQSRLNDTWLPRLSLAEKDGQVIYDTLQGYSREE